jgi:hypothetical protein
MSDDICCVYCKRPDGKGKRELRPYGPGGSWVCAGCVFGEDGKPPHRARVEEFQRIFDGLYDSAGTNDDMRILTKSGPKKFRGGGSA